MSDPLLDKLDEILRLHAGHTIYPEHNHAPTEGLRHDLRALLAEVAIEYAYRFAGRSVDATDRIRARFGVAPEQEERR